MPWGSKNNAFLFISFDFTHFMASKRGKTPILLQTFDFLTLLFVFEYFLPWTFLWFIVVFVFRCFAVFFAVLLSCPRHLKFSDSFDTICVYAWALGWAYEWKWVSVRCYCCCLLARMCVLYKWETRWVLYFSFFSSNCVWSRVLKVIEFRIFYTFCLNMEHDE